MGTDKNVVLQAKRYFDMYHVRSKAGWKIVVIETGTNDVLIMIKEKVGKNYEFASTTLQHNRLICVHADFVFKRIILKKHIFLA